MSFYLLVFMAAQAAGGALWGAVAQLAGVETALSAVAALLVLGLLGTRRFGLRSLEGPDLSPSSHWPEPQLVFEPEPDRGPVLITVEYRVPAEHHDAFRSAMRPVGRSRQRTGAYRWHLFQDGEDPDRFLETYVVATWQEHRRQHDERLTVRDQELEARALALTGGPGGPRVAHLISAYAEDR
jgi:quinol monooxygenase YgiN